ncbi:MAG: hypothetical protein L0958_03940 [Candidatus Mariimomonas ferrooxydans]
MQEWGLTRLNQFDPTIIIIVNISTGYLSLHRMKILFKILDYIISVLMGTGTLFLVSLVVSESWNMFFAMIAGMVLGLVVLLLTVLLFMSVSTAFELFPVGMVITMFIGMATGMVITLVELDFILMLLPAITLSLFAKLWIDLYNMKLEGEVTVDKKY